MSDHDRDRDNTSGRFVSDQYADTHHDTTSSEDVRNPVKAALRRVVAAYDAPSGVTGDLRDAIETARALL